MLPRLPTPNAAVLKRIQAQPLDYWQHVGDPLADLLATIYPIDDAETLLKLIEYEAEQEQPLCLQFLAQESATARWQEPRYKAELTAWQAYVQQFPLAVRLAWQAGGGLRLHSENEAEHKDEKYTAEEAADADQQHHIHQADYFRTRLWWC